MQLSLQSLQQSVATTIAPCIYDKVTVRVDFFGTVPNIDGLSRESYKVFRDTELSRIPDSVPILSRFECDVTSHVDHFDGLISIPNSLSSDAFM